MAKSFKTKGGRIVSKSKAFALGLSGAGLIVSPAITLRALQDGDSVRMAWFNVGESLTRSADKHFNGRRRAETK